MELRDYTLAPVSHVHRKVRAGAYLGMASDGYILGIVGAALVAAEGPLGLTSFWMGVIGGGTFFGILFGSIIFGAIADRIGRKLLFNSLMAVFVICSVAQIFITDPAVLAVMRLVMGACVGCDYTVQVSLLNEWMPEKHRTKAMDPLVFFWTAGYVLSFIAGEILIGVLNASWEIILASSAVLCGINFFVRLGAPESPSWLMSTGKGAEAQKVVQKHLGPEYCVNPIETSDDKGTVTELFSRKWRYNTLSGGIMYATQCLPFFAISLFLPIVLRGMNIDDPLAPTILYHTCTMVGVAFGTWLLQHISRRGFLFWTYLLSAILLGLFTVGQSLPSWLQLALLGAFSLVLAASIAIEWPYPAELFPTRLRCSGVGMVTAISRIGAGGGTFLLPIVVDSCGAMTSLFICVGTLVFGLVVCQLWAPETNPKFIRPDAPKVEGVPVPPVALRG